MVFKLRASYCYWTTYFTKYHVCAVRSLCVDDESKKNLDNKTLTGKFVRAKSVRSLFLLSCITTFSEGKHEKKNRRSNKDSSSSSKDETVSEQNFYPGMSLWIVFILPEYGLVAFEECISKEI